MGILRALFAEPYAPQSFSTLREHVGERDSGKFNYHLGKLVGRFVRKSDDGYELTLAGWQIIGAVLSGAYTASGTIDPIDLTVSCPACEGTVRLTYEDERVTVACLDWRSNSRRQVSRPVLSKGTTVRRSRRSSNAGCVRSSTRQNTDSA